MVPVRPPNSSADRFAGSGRRSETPAEALEHQAAGGVVGVIHADFLGRLRGAPQQQTRCDTQADAPLFDLFAENAFLFISNNLNYIMLGVVSFPAFYILFYKLGELLNNLF